MVTTLLTTLNNSENDNKLTNFCGLFHFRVPVCDILNNLTFETFSDAKCALTVLSAVNFLTKTKKSPWCQLNARWMGKITASNFAKVCDQLIDAGLLIRSPQYKVGEFSKSFRKGPALEGVKWKVSDLKHEASNLKPTPKNKRRRDFWETFIGEVKDAYDLPEDHPQKTLYMSIHESLKDISFEEDENTELEILEEARKAQIEGEKEVEMENLEIIKNNARRAARGWKEKPLKVVETTEESIAQGYRDSIEALKHDSSKYVKVHVDKNKNGKLKPGTNRVFTNITNLKGAWRKNLRYKGQKMVNVDIRCAQPSMMAAVYGPTPAEQAEKQRFIQFMTDFDFYGELASRSKGNKLTRSDAKRETFTLMFAKNYTMYQKNLYKVLEKEFPILAGLIAGVKKDNYKNFAFILQSTEAEIMIKGVLSELLLEKSIPAFSIHDSIMCLPEHRAIIEETIKRKFCDKLGFNPVLKDG